MPIRLFAIKAVGLEVSDADMGTYMGALTLPWLQDTAEQKAWERWSPTYRDVVIVDGQNVRLEAFNVTSQDLGNPANYDALKQKLLDAANGP